MIDTNLEVWRGWMEEELTQLKKEISWVIAQLDGAVGDQQVDAAREKVPTLLTRVDELLKSVKDRTKLQPPKKPMRW